MVSLQSAPGVLLHSLIDRAAGTVKDEVLFLSVVLFLSDVLPLTSSLDSLLVLLDRILSECDGIGN